MPDNDKLVQELLACPDYLTIPAHRAAREIDRLNHVVGHLCRWLDASGIVNAENALNAANLAVESRHAS